MLYPFRPYGDPSAAPDDEYPLGHVFDMVFWGIIVAAVPVVLGIVGIVTGETPWPMRDDGWDSMGFASNAFCAIFIAVGAFVHFHYFWGILRARVPYMLGRKLSLLVCALSLVVILVNFLRGWLVFA